MPSGSMRKFFADHGGPEHGGRLHWPGTIDGFPVRGETVPNLKQHEFEQIPLALDFHSDLFKLWEPEDKRRFDEVMDRIVNGLYMQHQRENIHVEGQILPAVRLEWVQIYGEIHTNKQRFGGPPAGTPVQSPPAAAPAEPKFIQQPG